MKEIGFRTVTIRRQKDSADARCNWSRKNQYQDYSWPWPQPHLSLVSISQLVVESRLHPLLPLKYLYFRCETRADVLTWLPLQISAFEVRTSRIDKISTVEQLSIEEGIARLLRSIFANKSRIAQESLLQLHFGIVYLKNGTYTRVYFRNRKQTI
jgi:hypothetical protein